MEKKKPRILLIITMGVALICFWGVGCGAGEKNRAPLRVGGPCKYAETRGEAIITRIGPVPAGEYSCKDGVEVVFDFHPDDANAKSKYRLPSFSDQERRFKVLGGANPPRQWVEKMGISPGKRFKAIRMEIKSGTCTPVIYKIPELDVDPNDIPCH